MKKNILYALLANLVTAGLALVLLLFLIRFGSKEDIGLYSLAQAIALPIHLFFTFKLRTVQLSDVQKDFDNSDYFNARLLLSMVSIIITVVLAVVLYRSVFNYILAISILGIGYSAMLIREFFISLYQINERNEYFLISNLIVGLATFIVFIVTYTFFGNIIFSIIAYSLTRVLSIMVDVLILNKFFNQQIGSYLKNIDKIKIKSLLRIGLPLGVTAVIASLLTSIPRVKLESIAGLETLGLFTTLMSIVAFFNLFMSSFSQALIPRLVKTYNHSKQEFIKKLTVLIIALSVFLVGILIISFYNSKLIISVIFGNEFINYSDQFFIAILAGCILSLFHFTNMLLNIQRSFKPQVFIYSVTALTCLIFAYILIPVFELEGAIFTSIISSLIGSLVSIVYFYYRFQRSN